jgi:UDP-GlcNAc3NAcA epimerase
LHPRTRERIQTWSLAVPDRVRLSAPVPYTEMLALERGARAIATDSGGVVREAYLWGVPCVTLREETEWVETVQTGWNATVGADPDRFAAALAHPRPEKRPPVLGDGRAAERIAALTAETLLDVQGRAA